MFNLILHLHGIIIMIIQEMKVDVDEEDLHGMIRYYLRSVVKKRLMSDSLLVVSYLVDLIPVSLQH